MAMDAKIEGLSPASSRTVRALWWEAAGRGGVREAETPALREGQAFVRTLFTGVSRGTERLVFTGAVPPSEYARMRCPMQEGEFSFPIKYGYCAVGITEDGPPDLIGRPVFALHPHQTGFVADAATLRPLPEGLPPRRAVLAANMETALNAVWDSGAGPGDRIVVVGAGIVGMLTAYLCARLPGADVTLVDVNPDRAAPATQIGVPFAPPEAVAQGVEADVVFHASATAPGLACALACAGFEARVVEMSWHGAAPVPTPLGGAFHSKRLQLMSTQVGQVSPSRRPRWDYARRMAKAMELLRDDRLDALLDTEIPFEDFCARAPEIFAKDAKGLGVVVRY